MGCTDPLRRGSRRTPSVSSRVDSKLPLPLYADVRFHIPMTHRNDAGTDSYSKDGVCMTFILEVGTERTMPSTFTYANNNTANNTSAGALILRPPDGFYAVGETYRFPALQVNTLLSFFSNGNPYEKRDVKYIVGTDEWLNADDVNTHAPADLNKTSVANATPIKNHIFINGDNGDMLIQFPHFQPKNTTKSYAITLEVIDPAGAIQVLERMILQVEMRCCAYTYVSDQGYFF